MANHLKSDRKQAIIGLLVEGCSIRSIERVTGVHRDTICRLLVRVGEHCEEIMDREMRGLSCGSLQLDEMWGYVAKKQKRVRPDDPREFGDAYSYIALDRKTKLIPAIAVGKRDEPTTMAFVCDLSSRIDGEIQIFTDGWGAYKTAIPRYFGRRAHFVQIVKHFAGEPDERHRYSPPRVRSIEHIWIQGFPQARLVSTSHVERHNWTIRTHLRRLTRLSNGFSRKLKNLRAALNLYVCWYNWCKRHSSLRMTPAMAAGIADTNWPISALLPN